MTQFAYIHWLLALCLVFAGIGGAAATTPLPPPLPCSFFGSVTVDGDPAPAGTVVTALIGGSECGSLTTSESGTYGGSEAWDLKLLVQSDEADVGQTIIFRVNDALARETATYTPGNVQNLDLTVVACSLAVNSPAASPSRIPTETDGVSGWGETADLSVAVTGADVASVTVDLSGVGGSAAAAMSDTGDGTRSAGTTATLPSPFAAGAYLPVHLPVNATGTDGVSNITVSIPLTVVKNGDANEDYRVSLYDAVYIARHTLGMEGYPMTESVGEVSGDDEISIHDAMYLAKHVLAVPGFGQLH